MKITDIVLDFDGTCTVIPKIYEGYLSQFFDELNNQVFPQKHVKPKEWEAAKEIVRTNSPAAGWTLGTTPSAPAHADPYILAFEASKIILKEEKSSLSTAPAGIHPDCYAKHQAPWRPEAREVFQKLLEKGIRLHFITNSDNTAVTNRVLDLMDLTDLKGSNISVNGNAAKYNISELSPWSTDIPDPAKQRFAKIPAASDQILKERPVYFRRSSFFSAICASFNNDLSNLSNTVFCGDVWELDLALPAALGANIHLIERASPFDTYDYERKLTNAKNGKISTDLNGLKEWL